MDISKTKYFFIDVYESGCDPYYDGCGYDFDFVVFEFEFDCMDLLGRLWSYAFKALACGPGFEFEPPWLEVEKRSDGLGSNSVDF